MMRILLTVAFSLATASAPAQITRKQISRPLETTIITRAEWAVSQLPQTITSVTSPRSAGGPHDYFSEGDYWWPDPANPGGPYIQRDGQSNPDNFNAHRELLIRFSRIMGALGSAYVTAKDLRYVNVALQHAMAWFADENTRMNPSLIYAQAIHGRASGRGIGIIDTIHLMEVVQTLMVMSRDGVIDDNSLDAVKNWFREYLHWLTTHSYGAEEMNAKNNHGTCWVMQVACFAGFVGDSTLVEFCRERFKNVLLPHQMTADGSFPLEIARTKPYGYSIFNLDAMATICQILSTPEDNLWKFERDGKSIGKAIAFLFPFIADKTSWPHSQDVMYWDDWPVAQPFLIFGAVAFNDTAWLDTWSALDHDPQNKEILRNLPIRNPLIWLSE